ncbi:MAG: Isoprenylcysteine carboxyl methyltransferase [Patescibacteria group bacterium]|nr:Isoprenylcysteine carboxyl methyltransferase [Patescibacteria group bacterium]
MTGLYTPDNLLRLLTILLISTRYVYWVITARRAQTEKPRLQRLSASAYLRRTASSLAGALIYLQLFGLQILPFHQNLAIQAIGFAFVVIGFAVSMSARRTLGANWAHGAEYQIKTRHTLTTTGVYSSIRHPIYAGIFLSMIGAEIVAGSYVFLLFLAVLPIIAHQQAKKEEAILIREFGDDYKRYMRKTKMLIPRVW